MKYYEFYFMSKKGKWALVYFNFFPFTSLTSACVLALDITYIATYSHGKMRESCMLMENRTQILSRSPNSTGKILRKLLGRTLWPEFELRLPHLCVWVYYNGFSISSMYPKKIQILINFRYNSHILWLVYIL
jgi:hypothetical protein